jgi:phosphopentomutase
MGEEYMQSVQGSWDEIARITATLPEEYTVIVTADHGGHNRTHGTDCPEDMTIPLILKGAPFAPGKVLEQASIKDIAPTIAALLGAAPAPEWDGKSLI